MWKINLIDFGIKKKTKKITSKIVMPLSKKEKEKKDSNGKLPFTIIWSFRQRAGLNGVFTEMFHNSIEQLYYAKLCRILVI